MAALLVILVVTDRPDATLRDPNRLFAWGLALLFVLIPAALVWANAIHRRRSLPAGGEATISASPAGGGGEGSPGGAASCLSHQPHSRTAAGLRGEKPSPGRGPLPSGRARGRIPWSLAIPFAILAIAILAIGRPVQRDYLRARFANADPATSIPGMHLDAAYRWARGVHDARIGLAGSTAGFLQYGFYGTDLSNRVRYLGEEGPHGAYNAIPTCARFRAAASEAGLDYLVTAPFLDFIEPGRPVASPEARWLRGDPAVTPILRSGPVTVWRIQGRLNPRTCGPANAPLHEVPRQPTP